MADFVPIAGGARLLLDEAETDIIKRLTVELRTLLVEREIEPGDPVYDRLFPAAYDDATDEAAYRELIGDGLLAEKLQALDAVAQTLGPAESAIELTEETLDAWLACLADLRLAIGTRLDVDEERMADDIDPNDPDARSLAVLHWLGWLQDGAIRAGTTL